jgi:hypothetical protein
VLVDKVYNLYRALNPKLVYQPCSQSRETWTLLEYDN